MSIRAIVFDAAGTLIYPEPNVVDVYHRLGQKFHSKLDPSQIRQRFQASFRSHFVDRAQSGGETSAAIEKRKWEHLVREVFSDVDAFSELFSDLWAHFANRNHWRCFDDVAECMEWLAAQSLIVAIGSNFDDRLTGVVPYLMPLRSIQHIFYSAAIGWMKPAAPFFRAIEQSLDLPPHEILMVGDTLETDVQGARRSGWQALWINRPRTSVLADNQSQASQPIDQIRSLAELPNWLRLHG